MFCCFEGVEGRTGHQKDAKVGFYFAKVGFWSWEIRFYVQQKYFWIRFLFSFLSLKENQHTIIILPGFSCREHPPRFSTFAPIAILHIYASITKALPKMNAEHIAGLMDLLGTTDANQDESTLPSNVIPASAASYAMGKGKSQAPANMKVRTIFRMIHSFLHKIVLHWFINIS